MENSEVEPETIYNEHPFWAREWALGLSSYENSGLKIDTSEVCRRIKVCLPEVSIIYVLRNQQDWIRSVYFHYWKTLNNRKNSLGDFLNTLEGQSILQGGFYDRVLDTLTDIFTAQKVHILFFEDLKNSPELFLKNLCHILGTNFYRPRIEKYNKNAGKSTLGKNSGSLIASLLAKRINGKNNFTTSDKGILSAFYKYSNIQLKSIIGRDIGTVGYSL